MYLFTNLGFMVIHKYSPNQNFTIKKVEHKKQNVVQHDWKIKQFVNELKWLKLMEKDKGQRTAPSLFDCKKLALWSKFRLMV